MNEWMNQGSFLNWPVLLVGLEIWLQLDNEWMWQNKSQQTKYNNRKWTDWTLSKTRNAIPSLKLQYVTSLKRVTFIMIKVVFDLNALFNIHGVKYGLNNERFVIKRLWNFHVRDLSHTASRLIWRYYEISNKFFKSYHPIDFLI